MFGAVILLGAGIMMLGGDVSESWTIVDIAVVLLAAAAALTRGILSYLRSQGATEDSDNNSLVWASPPGCPRPQARTVRLDV